MDGAKLQFGYNSWKKLPQKNIFLWKDGEGRTTAQGKAKSLELPLSPSLPQDKPLQTTTMEHNTF